MGMLCRLSDWRKKHFYRGQTDRPRVLHVITGLHVGGAENFLYRLLSTFDHECLKHAVACFKWGPVAQKIGALGVPVHQVSRVFYRNDYLGEFVKNWKPDVIHASEWTANVLARSLKKDQPKIPIVCALHSNPDYHGFIRNFFERWMPLPDKFVAVSRGVVEGYERNIVAHLGNDAAKSFRDRLKVIENGINIDYYAQPSGGAVSLRRELGIPPHAFVVGAVGRMVPIKAYDHLIDSFSFFLKSVNGNAHLVFVGEGPERARLESYVENLGLGAWVHFVGLQRDLLQWYAMFDA
ncbi:glycosyltransferase, partial [bacterium]|nr:glycosyltransferase [bacterium]